MQSSLKPNHFSIHSYVGFLNSRPLYKLFSLLQNVAFSCIKTQCINRMMHQKWDNKYKCSQNCCIHSNTKQVHDQPNQSNFTTCLHMKLVQIITRFFIHFKKFCSTAENHWILKRYIINLILA